MIKKLIALSIVAMLASTSAFAGIGGSTPCCNANSYELNGILLYSSTAPTIYSGFGTGASIIARNGTAAFEIDVGTGGTAGSGILTFPPAANGWICSVADSGFNGSAGITDTFPGGKTFVTVRRLNAGSPVPWSASTNLYLQCAGF